jgi:hypothetical protein
VKYMLLLVRSDEDWEALSDEERDYESIMRWWVGLAQQGVLRDGGELQPARTATTVRWEQGRPLIMDGPFMEAKETIGGYGVIEVDDLDAAIAIARTWPAKGHKVEIRPLVPR